MKKPRLLLLSWVLALGPSGCHPSSEGGPKEEPAVAPPTPLTASERRGKVLFLTGRSADGRELTALVGDGDVELPPAAAACARCHGRFARGTEEGGAVAPPIGARTLFEVVTPSGRRAARPAYTITSLGEAITRGRSSSGRELARAMPRFPMRTDDLADLIAYLERVDGDADPGVRPSELHIGATLPLSGAERSLGEDVKNVLEAYFADVNASGGVFRRRISLVVEDSAREPGAARRLLDHVLALVGSVAEPGDDDALAGAGALSLAPVRAPAGRPDGGATYHLYAGPELQARAAVLHWLRERGAGASVVVVDEGEDGTAWSCGAEDELVRRGQPSPTVIVAGRSWASSRVARATCARRPKVVFAAVSSGDRAAAIARECAPAPVYLPELALSYAPEVARGRFVHVAPLADEHSRGTFEVFLHRHGLASRNARAQRDAHAAATLLVQALKRAGADLTRAALVDAVESMRDAETVTTPPVSFGRSRRTGITTAAIAHRGPGGKLVEASPRIEPPPSGRASCP